MMKCIYFCGVCAVLALASVPASAGFVRSGGSIAAGFAADNSSTQNRTSPVIQVVLRRDQKTKRTKRIKSRYQ